MNIVPGLTRHPKYLRLKRRLVHDAAEYLINVWEHCQIDCKGSLWRGADAEYVEIVAGWPGPNGKLYKALVECGWIKETESGVVIHDWDHYNARLVSSWSNGSYGARRRKEKQAKEPELPLAKTPNSDLGHTQNNSGLPPNSDLGQPKHELEGSRSDQIRSDQIPKGGGPPSGLPQQESYSASQAAAALPKGSRARERHLKELREMFVTLRAQLRDYKKIAKPTDEQARIIEELNTKIRALRKEQRELCLNGVSQK